MSIYAHLYVDSSLALLTQEDKELLEKHIWTSIHFDDVDMFAGYEFHITAEGQLKKKGTDYVEDKPGEYRKVKVDEIVPYNNELTFDALDTHEFIEFVVFFENNKVIRIGYNASRLWENLITSLYTFNCGEFRSESLEQAIVALQNFRSRHRAMLRIDLAKILSDPATSKEDQQWASWLINYVDTKRNNQRLSVVDFENFMHKYHPYTREQLIATMLDPSASKEDTQWATLLLNYVENNINKQQSLPISKAVDYQRILDALILISARVY